MVQIVKRQVCGSALLRDQWLCLHGFETQVSSQVVLFHLWLIPIANLIVQLVPWYTGSEVLHHAHFYDDAHKRKRREAQIEAFVVKNLGSEGNVQEMGNANVEIGSVYHAKNRRSVVLCHFISSCTKTCPFAFFEKYRTAYIPAPLVAGV